MDIGEVRDFRLGDTSTLHGIVDAIDGDRVTMRSTTNDNRLTVPVGDVGDLSGPGWFDLEARNVIENGGPGV